MEKELIIELIALLVNTYCVYCAVKLVLGVWRYMSFKDCEGFDIVRKESDIVRHTNLNMFYRFMAFFHTFGWRLFAFAWAAFTTGVPWVAVLFVVFMMSDLYSDFKAMQIKKKHGLTGASRKEIAEHFKKLYEVELEKLHGKMCESFEELMKNIDKAELKEKTE